MSRSAPKGGVRGTTKRVVIVKEHAAGASRVSAAARGAKAAARSQVPAAATHCGSDEFAAASMPWRPAGFHIHADTHPYAEPHLNYHKDISFKETPDSTEDTFSRLTDSGSCHVTSNLNLTSSSACEATIRIAAAGHSSPPPRGNSARQPPPVLAALPPVVGASVRGERRQGEAGSEDTAEVRVVIRVRPQGSSERVISTSMQSRQKHIPPRCLTTVDTARGVVECVGAPVITDCGQRISAALLELESSSGTAGRRCHPYAPAAPPRSLLHFSFDTVLNENAQQAEVMDSVGLCAVERVMAGFHATVLCYGQSGCGKTHTLMGPAGGQLKLEDCAEVDAATGTYVCSESVGLAPRMLQALFSQLQKSNRSTVQIGAVELYNEELRDLLPDKMPPVWQPPRKTRKQQLGSASLDRDAEGEERTATGQQLSDVDSKSSGDGAEADVVVPESTPSGRRPRRTPKSRRAKQSPMKESAPLRIRDGPPMPEASSFSVHVDGLRYHTVADLPAAMAAIRCAQRGRTLAATNLNHTSSRSHTIFFIHVHQPDTGRTSSGHPIAKHSVLTLVDLAGSERVGHTGAEGLRLQEAKRINLSLSYLGKVIRRLSSKPEGSGGANAHIPYRDSKLTRLLRDSFGGNTVTVLLCNISPDGMDSLETLSTLRFAKLAKEMTNRVTMNTLTEQSAETATAVAAAQAETRLYKSQLHYAYKYTEWLEEQLGAAWWNSHGVEDGATTSRLSLKERSCDENDALYETSTDWEGLAAENDDNDEIGDVNDEAFDRSNAGVVIVQECAKIVKDAFNERAEHVQALEQLRDAQKRVAELERARDVQDTVIERLETNLSWYQQEVQRLRGAASRPNPSDIPLKADEAAFTGGSTSDCICATEGGSISTIEVGAVRNAVTYEGVIELTLEVMDEETAETEANILSFNPSTIEVAEPTSSSLCFSLVDVAEPVGEVASPNITLATTRSISPDPPLRGWEVESEGLVASPRPGGSSPYPSLPATPPPAWMPLVYDVQRASKAYYDRDPHGKGAMLLLLQMCKNTPPDAESNAH